MSLTFRAAHVFTWSVASTILTPIVVHNTQLVLDLLAFIGIAFLITCALMVATVLDV